ncbi:MAG: carboxypeptidase regulatory-like domain-containing protein [Lapillicoccus sp.]
MIHPVDAEMLARLGAIVDVVDPVPPQLVEMGRALFAFRDPDAELMHVVDTADLAGTAVRSGWPSRMHFFEFDEVSLDVELTVSDTFCAVLGAVTTASGAEVPAGWSIVVETPSATYTAPVAEEGRFELARVPLGMIRFTLDRVDAGRVTTPWLDAR